MHYVASYVPLARDDTPFLLWDGVSEETPEEKGGVFDLLARLGPEDHLWLMMGSTNSTVALSAFRRGAAVHQLSLPRARALIGQERSAEDYEGGEEGGHGPRGRVKLRPQDVLQAARRSPGTFYGVSSAQAEVLEIMSVWQKVNDAMEARKAAANLLRSRIYHEAVVYGTVRGVVLPDDPAAAGHVLEDALFALLSTKDKNGRKRTPDDPHVAFLTEGEKKMRAELEGLCRKSRFYGHLFGDVEHVGAMLGARFVAAVERIERFAEAADLSNYAGMLPRGKGGKLPSRRKGEMLSRSPKLNNACFLLQTQMFQYGRKTALGQVISRRIAEFCPDGAVLAPEERKKDKELARRYAGAVKQARIVMSRHFLEDIVWPRWREYASA